MAHSQEKIVYLITGLTFVLVFSAVLIKNNSKHSSGSGPRIEFTTEKLDLGDVKMGQRVDYDFQFTNAGEDTLVILDVKPSCGCTSVVLDDKRTYFSGESGTIKFTFNTEGHPGMNNKNINVTTNEVNNPNKVLSFTVNVIQ